MNCLFEDKRIFDQDGTDHYLVLSKEHIKKYCWFYDVIMIEKGNLLYPKKWIRHESDVLILEDEFDFCEYEYILPALSFVTDLLLFDELTNESVDDIIKNFEQNAYKEAHIVEVYSNPDDNQPIILDLDATNHDILHEYTVEFARKEIKSTYQNGSDFLYLMADPSNSRYKSDEYWYYMTSDASLKLTTIKLFNDIEDMLPFTPFKKI